MKVVMVYHNFLDASGADQKIGGVETYLWTLARLILERGDEPILLQRARTAFESQVAHLKVIGVEGVRKWGRENVKKHLYDAARSLIDTSKNLIIFGTDQLSVRTGNARTVSIQHGIAWDAPARFLRESCWLGRIPLVPDAVCKRYTAYRCYSSFNNCLNRVCVDYNFLNWYRTQITDTPRGNVWVIPNFVDIPEGYQQPPRQHYGRPVRIIFARRFSEIRGTRLMIEAARRVLDAFQDVEFCFAGEGPDQPLIVDAFQNEPRVSIRKYLPDESLRIHESFDIAVVPSLACEGTSLSLAEAMAAGCAVVATNVGGMTNMVISGYNGCLIAPDADSLAHALLLLVKDEDLRLKLGTRAAETAQNAFSLKRWKSRWSEVLDHLQTL
jgi:glycosyltransferase involved in cell wall biosynthesis